MTDSNDHHKRSRSGARGRPGQNRRPGERSFRPRSDTGETPRRDGGKPFRPRLDNERPRPPREGGKAVRTREDSRPARNRRDDGDRPRRFGRDQDSRPHRHEEPTTAHPVEPAEERIAKVIARAGIASRRDVEAMIAEGRVSLNGQVLDSPAINVTKADRIVVDGEPLPAQERTRLWLFHKPRGLVTTARDPQGRSTVFEYLPEDMPRVVAVGRLDINTEGLLLLTNDGGLARVIAHPETGWLRRYKVRAYGDLTQADLDKLRDGITIEGIEYGPVEARLDRVQGDNLWMTLGLREGKNREVKRILEHLGVRVNRLIRLSFGPFQLGELEEGLVEEVRTKVLKDQLGEALAVEAGVDFESPVRDPIAPFGSPKKREREDHSGDEIRERRPSDRFGRDRDRQRQEHGGRRPEIGSPQERPSRLERKTSVWRKGENEDQPRRKPPRRGADPKEARLATAERPRERVGAIRTEGRKVVVERLVSSPREEAPVKQRYRGPASGDDRPRRPPARSAAPATHDRRDDSKNRKGGTGRFKPDSDRPFRDRKDREEGFRPSAKGAGPSRNCEGKPFRAQGGDDRPQRGRGHPGKSGGDGFKSGPKGPFKGKGSFKDKPRGGPRGRP